MPANNLKIQSRVAVIVIAGIYVTLCVGGVQGQERSASHLSKLLGDWTGESICIGNNPGCHDEKVVYRISRSSGGADTVTLAADKVVDGKPEPMGVLELKYDPNKETLAGEFHTTRYHGLWEYTVKGNIMEGTLTLLPDKTIARRIKVTRNESNQRESNMTTHATGTFAIEKVSGTLKGQKGTFVLQHSGTMTRGEGQLTIGAGLGYRRVAGSRRKDDDQN